MTARSTQMVNLTVWMRIQATEANAEAAMSARPSAKPKWQVDPPFQGRSNHALHVPPGVDRSSTKAQASRCGVPALRGRAQLLSPLRNDNAGSVYAFLNRQPTAPATKTYERILVGDACFSEKDTSIAGYQSTVRKSERYCDGDLRGQETTLNVGNAI